MTRGTHTQMQRGWLTGARLMLTSLMLALAALFASNCTSPETSRERNANTANSVTQTATSPSVPVKANPPNSSAPTAANTSAPTNSATLEAIPENVLQKELKALDGKSFRLADYRGKVVVVDLWATWCGPCRATIPHLVKMRNDYDPNQVEIIGLTTEDPDIDAEKVRAFVQNFQINYRIGWVEGETAMTLMRGRGVIPQALVITKDGHLFRHFVGYSPAIADMMRQAIEQAKGMPG